MNKKQAKILAKSLGGISSLNGDGENDYIVLINKVNKIVVFHFDYICEYEDFGAFQSGEEPLNMISLVDRKEDQEDMIDE